MKAVVLAGGGGTRLWPLSTPEKPKQFQKLVSDRTMIELTLERIDFLQPTDIYITTNEKNTDLAKKLCPQISSKNFIIEPAMRDTAPCIGLAAAIIEKEHPGEIMAVIYADHLIKNKKEFQEKLKQAEKIALQNNTLNIVEVEAKEPNTHYGYVKLGAQIDKDLYHLDSFKEKPDLETAKKFVAAGNYLWNTGIYVWKAQTLLQHYQKLQPEIYAILQKIVEENNFSAYEKCPKISLDYAIMEKVAPAEVRIIKADLGWSDIGSWEAIWQELSQNPSDNITRGQTEEVGSSGCLIYADNSKKIAAIGLEDTIIVDTPDGLLVCKKQESKRVKELKLIHMQ